MKLQIFILAIGVAASAGAVSAELHRAASTTSVVQTATAPIAAAQSALKQSVSTTPSTLSIGVKPSIKGGVGGDD